MLFLQDQDIVLLTSPEVSIAGVLASPNVLQHWGDNGSNYVSDSITS